MLYKDKLYNILDELQCYKGSRIELLAQCVQERLDTALDAYKHALDSSCEYLAKKNELTVLKKLNRGK